MRTTSRSRFCRCSATLTPTIPAPRTITSARALILPDLQFMTARPNSGEVTYALVIWFEAKLIEPGLQHRRRWSRSPIPGGQTASRDQVGRPWSSVAVALTPYVAGFVPGYRVKSRAERAREIPTAARGEHLGGIATRFATELGSTGRDENGRRTISVVGNRDNP